MQPKVPLPRSRPRLRIEFAALVSAVCLSVSVAAPAAAHSELVSSTPADGAMVPSPLYELIVLEFSAPLAEGSKAELLEAPYPDPETGLEISPLLDVAIVDGPAGTMSFPLMADLGIGSGSFVIEWTSVAEDGHELSGRLAFAVADPGASIGSVPPLGGSATTSTAAATTPAATVSEAPAASQEATQTNTTGTGDLIVPIVALLVLVAVGAAILLKLRGRPLP